MADQDAAPIAVQQPAPPKARPLRFDPGSCRTCQVCVMSCAILKEGSSRPAVARLNIYFDEFADTDPISARICFHCADAPCLEVCPVEAIYRHPRTGAVIIDDETCVGCMSCAKACPWDVPKRHPDRRKAIKCDLCSDRPEGPYCVSVCPLSGKALTYTLDEALP